VNNIKLEPLEVNLEPIDIDLEPLEVNLDNTLFNDIDLKLLDLGGL